MNEVVLRDICKKYWLRGEANIPSRFSGEGHLTVLETVSVINLLVAVLLSELKFS
jgi:hypothetical protein